MPQKRNPDVLELVRARAARVLSDAAFVAEVLRAAPSGYNRDVQETKEPFFAGLNSTQATLRVMDCVLRGLIVHPDRLAQAFSPDVFATDHALELVARGIPFREAYHQVKAHLDDLRGEDPRRAVLAKTHLGAPAGIDFDELDGRISAAAQWVMQKRKDHNRAVSDLLRIRYPEALEAS